MLCFEKHINPIFTHLVDDHGHGLVVQIVLRQLLPRQSVDQVLRNRAHTCCGWVELGSEVRSRGGGKQQ